jgi:hypothetical protein
MQVLVPQLRSIFARWILTIDLWTRVHNNPLHANFQLVAFKEGTNLLQHMQVIYMHDNDGPSRLDINLLAKTSTDSMKLFICLFH